MSGGTSTPAKPTGVRARRRNAAWALALCALVVGVMATPALADVQWTLSSVHGPQNLVPGEDGQYVIQAANVGTTASGGTTTVVDALPAGVTATDVFGLGWSCTAPPATVITCTRGSVAPQGNSLIAQGLAATLFITVSVDALASGTGTNQVTVSSDGGAATASANDPTTFGAPQPGFGITDGSFAADAFDGVRPTASPVRQAGSHPFEFRVDFDTNLLYSTDAAREDPTVPKPFTEPDGRIRNVDVRLPAGLIGDPQATPRCRPELLSIAATSATTKCPANTQVGTAALTLSDGPLLVGSTFNGAPSTVHAVAVYNMVPPAGSVAALAFGIQGIAPVWILASVDPANHYAVKTEIRLTQTLLPVRSVRLRLWGVPADPAHNIVRANPNGSFIAAYNAASTAPIKPFLTLPSQCDSAGSTQMAMDSWEGAAFSASSSPATMTGCTDPRLRFQPSITVQPEARTPSTPSGLDVELTVPQKSVDTASGAADLYTGSGKDVALGTPPLRNAVVRLPAGMRVSPSSADGLAGCTSLQIGLGTDAEPTCPDSAKIGAAELVTPLLANPVNGSIYLAAQNDNPFGTLLAIYIVLDDPDRGLVIKLSGKIAPDPLTGQLTATFDDNPQLPFSSLRLHFKGGPRASLVTPPACGTFTSQATLTSWNSSLPAVEFSDSFEISGDGEGAACAVPGFHPSLEAGTVNPVAGEDSPLVTTISRPSGDQELRSVDVSMPPGLLGRLASVVLCSDADARAGTCTDGSRIGRVTVAAGEGSNPFYISDGRVYITEGYKGAPFGLSIVVHAKAGPFDLGNVVVRAQVLVDRTTAALRIVTDSLPHILAGIPLSLRLASVDVDRSGFTFNPTSCAPKQITGRISSLTGTVAEVSSRFQVGDCNALPFRPQMTLAVGGRRHTAKGATTPLTTKIVMRKGQANLRTVSVVLPTTINARLTAVNQACTLAEFKAGSCGSRARVGAAVAVTPLLRDPLRGQVYFVKNGRPLPDLMIALRGQVDVDLDGRVSIPGSKHLATTFSMVPDVPISSFTLRLVSGVNGPIGATRNLCSAKARAAAAGLTFVAQNGKAVVRDQRLRVRGCPKRVGQR